MKHFSQLSFKELKDQQSLFFLITVATLFAEGYAVSLRSGSVSDQFSSVILSFMPLAVTGLLLPFFLAKSFSEEWDEGTHVFLLSLPVPRFQIGLSKVLTFYGFGCFIFLCAMGGSHFVLRDNSLLETIQLYNFSSGFYMHRGIQGVQDDLFPPSQNSITVEEKVPQNLGKIWITTGVIYLSLLGLLLGLATLCESLKYSVRRFRFWTVFLTFNVGTYLYFKFYPGTDPYSQQRSSSQPIPFLQNTGDVISSDMLLFGSYTIVTGILFLVAGLWIFEKKTEV